MQPNRTLATALALASLAIAAVAEALVVRHVAGALGIAMLVVSGLVATAAWLALGAPRTRADLAR